MNVDVTHGLGLLKLAGGRFCRLRLKLCNAVTLSQPYGLLHSVSNLGLWDE